MRKIFYLLSAFTLGLSQISCEPTQLEGPDTDSAISSNDLVVTRTLKTGGAANTFIIKNETPFVGLSLLSASGGKVTVIDDKTLEVYMAFPGQCKISLTHITNGGTASKIDSFVVAEGDPEVLASDWYKGVELLTGGVNGSGSKTWVVDSLSNGHFGIGSSAATPTDWWSAGPLNKTNAGAYDDELTFELRGACKLVNAGNAYVSGPYKDASYFSNAYAPPCGDWTVNYTAPTNGEWVYNEIDKTMVLKASTPLIAGLFTGSKGDYVIRSLTADRMELSSKGGDNNWWALVLIRKGFEVPSVKYAAKLDSVGTSNDWKASFTVAANSLPISSYKVDFGDGPSSIITSTTPDDAAFTHKYIMKGTYTVKFIAVNAADNAEVVKSFTVDVKANDPSYVPPTTVPQYFVLYNDFDGTYIEDFKGDVGLTVDVVADPVNASNNVMHIVKDHQMYSNANLLLPNGGRFDLTGTTPAFKMKLYGTAGTKVIFKFENTDKGVDAWQTGTEVLYTIQANNTWEVVTFNFKGAPVANGGPADVTTSLYNKDYYNIVRIMLNAGDANGTYDCYVDNVQGPIVPGMKSLQVK